MADLDENPVEDFASPRLFLQNLMDLRVSVREQIGEIQRKRLLVDPPLELTPDSALRAIQAVVDGTLTSDDARIWARFLLSRRDVLLTAVPGGLLLAFLEEWSYPDILPVINARSLAAWRDTMQKYSISQKEGGPSGGA